MVRALGYAIILFLTNCFLSEKGVIATHESSTVEKTFKSNQLVPDVVPLAPTRLVHVNYGNDRVHLGNILKVSDVAFKPSVSWDAIADQWYTLTMVDPDIPSRALPILRELRHWLVVNIPGDNVADGEVLSSYLSPTPPPGSDLHRYTFLVYHQPDKIYFDELSLGLRTNFSISKFAKQYNLGKPIDGNFFQAEILHTITQLIE